MQNIFIIPDDAVDWRKLGFLTLSFYSSFKASIEIHLLSKMLLKDNIKLLEMFIEQR